MVLINNAGRRCVRHTGLVTPDGLEMKPSPRIHMANRRHAGIGPERTQAGTPGARVVNTVVRCPQNIGRLFSFFFYFDVFNTENHYRGFAVYGRSKVVPNSFSTAGLARAVGGVFSYGTCLNPGFVATRLCDGRAGVFERLIRIGETVAKFKPARRGNDCSTLGSSDWWRNVGGAYF